MTLRDRLKRARDDAMAIPEPRRSRAMYWWRVFTHPESYETPLGLAAPEHVRRECREQVRRECAAYDAKEGTR